MRLRKAWLWLLAAIVVAGAGAAPSIYRTALLGSGFMAQLVSRRDPQAILTEDMSGPGYELLWFFQPHVQRKAKRVTASMFGLGRRTAVFREGLGCTLVVDRSENELRAQAAGIFPHASVSDPDALWPEGERVDLKGPPQGVDRVALEAGVKAAFTEPDSAHPRRTRALVVVHGGRIVAERYAPEFDATMPLLGWSMSKMAINALVGIAVQDGEANSGR
jgi:hypothetical protein